MEKEGLKSRMSIGLTLCFATCSSYDAREMRGAAALSGRCKAGHPKPRSDLPIFP